MKVTESFRLAMCEKLTAAGLDPASVSADDWTMGEDLVFTGWLLLRDRLGRVIVWGDELVCRRVTVQL